MTLTILCKLINDICARCTILIETRAVISVQIDIPFSILLICCQTRAFLKRVDNTIFRMGIFLLSRAAAKGQPSNAALDGEKLLSCGLSRKIFWLPSDDTFQSQLCLLLKLSPVHNCILICMINLSLQFVICISLFLKFPLEFLFDLLKYLIWSHCLSVANSENNQ